MSKAVAELTHVTRMMTVGELIASIAHEITQPLAVIVTNADAGLRWLSRDKPNLQENGQAICRIIRDAKRASAVVLSDASSLQEDSPGDRTARSKRRHLRSCGRGLRRRREEPDIAANRLSR